RLVAPTTRRYGGANFYPARQSYTASAIPSPRDCHPQTLLSGCGIRSITDPNSFKQRTNAHFLYASPITEALISADAYGSQAGCVDHGDCRDWHGTAGGGCYRQSAAPDSPAYRGVRAARQLPAIAHRHRTDVYRPALRTGRAGKTLCREPARAGGGAL